jgi:hypothetical protein
MSLSSDKALQILNKAKALSRGKRPADISVDVFARWVKIAKAEYLYKPEYLDVLPGTFSAINSLSHLTEEMFLQALDQGVVRPSSSPREIDSWRNVKSTKVKPYRLLSMVIAVDPDADVDYLAQIVKEGIKSSAEVKEAFKGKGNPIVIDIKDWSRVNQEVDKAWPEAKFKEVSERASSTDEDRKATRYAQKAIHSKKKQSRYAYRCRLKKMSQEGNSLAQEYNKIWEA